MNKIKLIAGTSHPELAKKIAKNLKVELTPVTIKSLLMVKFMPELRKK